MTRFVDCEGNTVVPDKGGAFWYRVVYAQDVGPRVIGYTGFGKAPRGAARAMYSGREIAFEVD